ncbi:MAG TPA: substrate-binding domain-containing protein [Lysobacter sp.]
MLRAIGFALVWLWLLAATPAHAQDDSVERVHIRGSQTLATSLVPTVASSWLRDIGYGDIRVVRKGATLTEIHAVRDDVPLIVEIGASSSAQGFTDLIDGNTQVAMMTRRPTPAELDAGWQLGDLASQEQEFVLALDGVAVVVNQRNPIAGLSLAQLQRIFAGQVRDWREVGGVAGALKLHMAQRPGAAQDLMSERVMGGARWAPAQKHGDVRGLLAAVAADERAIGFVDLQQALPAGVRPVALSDGGRAIAPTQVAVMSEDYPLTRRLYLYGSQMMGALARSFALYAMTLPGQHAVERAGYRAVTLRPGRAVATQAGPLGYRQLVRDAVRIPLSLRFNFAGNNDSGVAASVYDSRSVRDIERLAALMRQPGLSDRGLIVIGFADVGAGSPAAAMMMSNDRADLVAHELMAMGIRVLHARGMGALLPLMRSAGDARYRNERVEIWLR